MTDDKPKTPRPCKDCKAQWGDKPPVPSRQRPAPYPGPRCKEHHYRARDARKKVAHERRVQDVYSLPAGAYAALYEAQGGHCALCPATGKRKRLAVDHDHKCCPGPTSCGACVRGLLCSNCNDMLAHVRDEPAKLEAAARYLRHPHGTEVLRDHVSRLLAAGQGDEGRPVVPASEGEAALRRERNHGSEPLPGVDQYTDRLQRASHWPFPGDGGG